VDSYEWTNSSARQELLVLVAFGLENKQLDLTQTFPQLSRQDKNNPSHTGPLPEVWLDGRGR
jgi:hypothetical protein